MDAWIREVHGHELYTQVSIELHGRVHNTRSNDGLKCSVKHMNDGQSFFLHLSGGDLTSISEGLNVPKDHCHFGNLTC